MQQVALSVVMMATVAPPDGGYGWVIVFACFVANLLLVRTHYFNRFRVRFR